MRHPLFVADSAGGYREATADEVIEAARAALSRRCRRGECFASPAKTKQYLSLKLGELPYETFVVMFLDKRHRLIRYAEMFRGTIDSAPVYPREVVKEALAVNAAAVILAHPHPSGVAAASSADEIVTRRLTEALALVDIRLLDHIIIAGGEAMSFAERGLL